jgi:hypothetical protein
LARARIPSRPPTFLRAWDDAPAILVSCPGPLRRHHAAVQPISQLALPQCLLGSEAQLLAFAAAVPEWSPRLFFVPLPEMFSNPASAQALANACGVNAAQGGTPRLVHLRFGGTRSARVLKDARNGLVLAENHRAPPITASNHPFARGLTVPASMRRVFATDPGVAVPEALGGGPLPLTLLQEGGSGRDFIAADLAAARKPPPAPGRRTPPEGLDIVSLAEFRSGAWAAGAAAAAPSAHLQAAQRQAARDGAPFVLVPWNLDHPGSAVPALIARTLRLQPTFQLAVRLVILPFNYPGQTGLIRRLVRQIRNTIEQGGAALPQLFLARLTRMDALPALRRLARVAWVDGNDPEQEWTMRRLEAAGFSPVLLDAGGVFRPGTILIGADDALTIQAETAFGLLHFHARLPSLRALRTLLAMTYDMSREMAARKARAAARDIHPG